jgi:hypothetical protein
VVSITNLYHGFECSCSKRIGHCHTPRDTQSSGFEAHKVETPLRQSDEQAITSLRRLIGGTESRKHMQQWWSRTPCNHGHQLNKHHTSAVSQKPSCSHQYTRHGWPQRNRKIRFAHR